MVIDELTLRKDMKDTLIDSYNDKPIDEIVLNGQSFHFAKIRNMTGTSEIMADNTVDEPIINLGVSGNTTQKSYEGYNLFDQDWLTQRKDFTKAEYNGEETIKCIPGTYIHTFMLPKTIEKGTEITISFKVTHPETNGNFQCYLYFEDGTTQSFTVYSSKEIQPDFQHYTSTRVANQDVVGIQVNFYDRFNYRPYYFKNFMLNIGGEKPYESYVGGTYSPNPDYPQSIENANSEGMSVVLHGANMLTFGKDFYINGRSYTHNGITYTVQSDGGIYCNGKLTGTSSYVGLNVEASLKKINFKTGNYTFSIQSNRPENNHPKGFELQSQIIKDGVRTWQNGVTPATRPLKEGETFCNVTLVLKATEEIDCVVYPMINYGTEILPYEPYWREEIAIPASVEVGGATVPLRFAGSNVINNNRQFKDKLIVDTTTNKVLYVQAFQILELTDDIVSSNQSETPNGIYLSFRFDASTPFNSIGIAKCNYAQNGVSGSMIDYNYFDVWDGGDSTRVDLHILGYFTQEEAIAMIKQKHSEGNPYLFQYPLAEPIEHDITKTDLGQSLLALATRKGTNYLEIKGNLAPSRTDLTYWRQIIPNE